MSSRIEHDQIVYGFYEGPEAMTTTKSLPMVPTEGLQTSQLLNLALAFARL